MGIALFCDKCIENKKKEELLNPGQLGKKLSNKLDNQNLESTKKEKVNTAPEVCENCFKV